MVMATGCLWMTHGKSRCVIMRFSWRSRLVGPSLGLVSLHLKEKVHSLAHHHQKEPALGKMSRLLTPREGG
jgi:hypothetical protein